MDLSFRELQRRLKELNLGPVAGPGITKDVLMNRWLLVQQEPALEEEEQHVDVSTNYENSVKNINPSFYRLISSSISNIPDIRPLETVRLMKNEEQNIWRIIYEELGALSNVQGGEEDEERLLWIQMVNKKGIVEYIDEKREVVDRFIEKYPIMFLVLLKSVNLLIPLLSSTRDEMLNSYDFLLDEIKLYKHEPLFMRNSVLIDNSPSLKGFSSYSLSYGSLASSLYAHALLYRTHQHHYRTMLIRLFGFPKTLRTIDARLSIISHYSDQMAISEIAVSLLALIYDIRFSSTDHLIYLFPHPFVQEILTDTRSVSNINGEFKVPITTSTHHRPTIRYIDETMIDEERLNITEDVIRSFNHNLISSYWPLFYPIYKNVDSRYLYSGYATLDEYLSNKIIYLMKETDNEEEFASMIAFMLYNLPDGEFIWGVVNNFTFPYAHTNFNSKEVTILKLLLPLLSNQDVQRLFNATRDPWINTDGKRKVVKLIHSEARKRGLK